MERLLLNDLIMWKDRLDRKPLIISGVRQCGKTYLINSFGKNYYENIVYINFEKRPEYKEVFELNLEPLRIIEELIILTNSSVKPEKTLIFFDEIQVCGKALTSLKYFNEEANSYHIIAAGSLLGVALAAKTSWPVGKVDHLTLYPMSFLEFLMANEKSNWIKTVKEGGEYKFLHNEFEELLKRYFLVGGMPAAVQIFIDTKDFSLVDKKLEEILEDYNNDMAKHASVGDYSKLRAIWRTIPQQLAKEGSKFIFSQVKQSYRAKDLENSLEWLLKAGLAYKVTKISQPFIPLSSYCDDTYFKLYLCDIGLLRKLSDVPMSAIMDGNAFYKDFKGAMTENYVLNELVKIYNKPPVYWKSENSAELDFIIQNEEDIVPIEVKSGRATHTKSMSVYCNKYKPKKSIVTSMEYKKSILPLYALWNIKNYLSLKG